MLKGKRCVFYAGNYGRLEVAHHALCLTGKPVVILSIVLQRTLPPPPRGLHQFRNRKSKVTGTCVECVPDQYSPLTKNTGEDRRNRPGCLVRTWVFGTDLGVCAGEAARCRTARTAPRVPAETPPGCCGSAGRRGAATTTTTESTSTRAQISVT